MADETASATDAPQNNAPQNNESTTPAGDGDLREAGQRALAAERQARREAEARLKELEPLAAKAKALEDANKTELERLTDQLRAAETAGAGHAAAALRLEVALDKAPEGMSPAKIRSLAKRLTGSTREELEADAEELFAEFAPAPAATESDKPAGKNIRPTPTLRRTVPVAEDTKADTSAEMNDWLRRAASR